MGLPGAGKSSVGRRLAKRLGCEFFDTDAEIERRTGYSISQHFAREGEPAFRVMESQVISELVGSAGVLSTGGGAVLLEENRKLLQANSRSVYLHATPEELYRRLRSDTKRPLLQVADPQQKLRDLYLQRDPLYREVAQFIIDTERPSVETLVNIILTQFDKVRSGKALKSRE